MEHGSTKRKNDEEKFAGSDIGRDEFINGLCRVVTLHGNVPTQSVMQRAISLAQSVKGVQQVKSGLRLR